METKVIEDELLRFFSGTPHMRTDAMKVSDELINRDFARKFCEKYGVHCTYYLPTKHYSFERPGWREEHLKPYQIIIA